MSKIRYALVGFGGIAENRLAKEGFSCDRDRFSPLATAELVGATDVNPSRREAAEKLGLKWYASADDVYADKSIDAVFIATNNMTHAELAFKALEAGKHVIVEKPMAADSAAAQRISDMAKSKKLSLAVDHMMTESCYNRKAREVVRSGAIGTVNDSCFHMEFCYGSTPEEASSWRCSRPEELGGPIGDVASHCFYMAEFMFDSKIVGISCVYSPKTMDIVVENGAYIKFRMENGMTGSVKVSFSEPRGGLVGTLTNLGYELYGSEAVLRGFGTMFQLSGHPGEPIPVRLEIDRADRQEKVDAGQVVNIYQQVVLKHADSIIKGVPMSGDDAVRNLKMIEAAHESARQQGWPVNV